MVQSARNLGSVMGLLLDALERLVLRLRIRLAMLRKTGFSFFSFRAFLGPLPGLGPRARLGARRPLGTRPVAERRQQLLPSRRFWRVGPL